MFQKSFSQKSVMQKDFSRVAVPSVQRSKFNLSHGHKTTMDAGWLYPILVEEVLPGDTHTLDATIFARFATLINPIMDNVFLDVFYFFCPNRLSWNNWERFQGAQDNPGDSVDYVIPTIKSNVSEATSLTFPENSLGDYFGLPTVVAIQDYDYPSAIPFRDYNLIINTWFRDENLQDSLPVPKGDGPDDFTQFVIQRRGKRHDYFTSALPWPQKGNAVPLTLQGFQNVPVIGNGDTLGLTNAVGQNFGMVTVNGAAGAEYRPEAFGQPAGTNAAGYTGTPTGVRTLGVTATAADSGLVALTSQLQSIAITVNDLRTAVAYQQLLELEARSGTRYVEILKAQFGVSPQDYRLQRPEYLGGGSTPVGVSSVPQTSQTDTTPQGTLAAFGQVASFSGFHKSFDEHGYIIGLANIRADITYQQGMRRHWSRKTKHDFYNPVLANLGEQAILNKEIYYDFIGEFTNDVFGYIGRWDEYRYTPSYVTSAMRSASAAPLDSWHLALDFDATPTLSSGFIVDMPPIERVIAVTNEAHFIVDMYFQHMAVRPMPIVSIPGLKRL